MCSKTDQPLISLGVMSPHGRARRFLSTCMIKRNFATSYIHREKSILTWQNRFGLSHCAFVIYMCACIKVWGWSGGACAAYYAIKKKRENERERKRKEVRIVILCWREACGIKHKSFVVWKRLHCRASPELTRTECGSGKFVELQNAHSMFVWFCSLVCLCWPLDIYEWN